MTPQKSPSEIKAEFKKRRKQVLILFAGSMVLLFVSASLVPRPERFLGAWSIPLLGVMVGLLMRRIGRCPVCGKDPGRVFIALGSEPFKQCRHCGTQLRD
jgi:hypothetical protein